MRATVLDVAERPTILIPKSRDPDGSNTPHTSCTSARPARIDGRFVGPTSMNFARFMCDCFAPQAFGRCWI